jgi:hypothetical protein
MGLGSWIMAVVGRVLGIRRMMSIDKDDTPIHIVAVETSPPPTAQMVFSDRRRAALKQYGVHHLIWSYVHTLSQDSGGKSILSQHERNTLDAALLPSVETARALCLIQHRVLMTNGHHDMTRHVHGIDAMYTGLYGRFRIPYVDSTSALCWSERVKQILRGDSSFFVCVYNSTNDCVYTISSGQRRVDEVMMSTTDQYTGPRSGPPLYSIRIIFDPSGMTLEFRRDINNIYLVMQTLSSIMDLGITTHDGTYMATYEIVDDPVVLLATCMLLKNNCRYPLCTRNDIATARCLSVVFTRTECVNRHHALATIVAAATVAFRDGVCIRISVARPVYTHKYGTVLPRFNSETYDVDLFDRGTPMLSIQDTLSIDRQDNGGERLVIYSSLYNHEHVRTMINRDYLPAHDVLARHFLYEGHCRPALTQMHYQTMGIEVWIFEGRRPEDDWILNVSVNTSRFDMHAFVVDMEQQGWTHEIQERVDR